MRRRLVPILAVLILAGCGGVPKVELQDAKDYARGAYLQGYADGKAEVRCQPVVVQNTIMIAPAVAPACDRARQDAAALREVSREADEALTKNTPDRKNTLMRYRELGGRAAAP